MEKPVHVACCALILLGLLGLGCGRTESGPSELVQGIDHGIPEGEYELFANLVNELQSAETNLTQARNRLNRIEIEQARAALERDAQLMDQLFIAKYGEQQVEAWTHTILAIEDHQKRETLARMRGQELLARFEDHGATGRLDEEGFLVALTCRNTQFPKSLLRRLANCPRLTEVDLSSTELRDYHLENLGPAHSIRQLNLSGNPINGNGLKFLASLRELRGLNLSATHLTGSARNRLRPLTQLEHLNSLHLVETPIPIAEHSKIQRLFKQTSITF